MPLVPSDKPSNLRHSAAALTPRAKTSAMAISSSVILGGSEAPGVTKSQDLTKSWTSESLAAGSALMKLVDGRWCWKGRITLEWRGCGPQMTGSPIDEGPIASPRVEQGRVLAGKRFSLWNPRITRKGVETNKIIQCTFLAYWVTRHYLSSSRRCSASAATYSGVAFPVSKTVNLALT
ncbi:hypothetical protein Cgig2_008310 [Carnegiea gigantea]|uniref:Uncharacterized protein n=1 Tax=Carnegiea gigantea TaxID=171969 RepID=A0A9Q1JTG9_9CARY|nr:hypothetical protein Cgig2_008310 [Carnegiea gigantea]